VKALNLTFAELQNLLEVSGRTCLSLYQPTHKTHPENAQDPIRYKNLVRELESSLRERFGEDETENFLKPFRDLQHDSALWNYASQGLAVFGDGNLFKVYSLDRTVPELTVVAESFHTKPLIRSLQGTKRYQVLSVNREQVRFFEGTRDSLQEIPLHPEVPGNIEDALGSELTDPHQTVASYGGTALGSAMRHSHGGKSPQIEIDEQRFFRVIDRKITEYHSQPSGLPLILAALDQHQNTFRSLSHNQNLLPEGIKVDPDGVSIDKLRALAWKVIEPEIELRLRSIVTEFEQARAKGLGEENVEVIYQAALKSRVRSLLVDSEKLIPGRLDEQSGSITHAELSDPQVGDVLDDIAELVIKRGGEVLVVPQSSMPADTGIAAIYRY